MSLLRLAAAAAVHEKRATCSGLQRITEDYEQHQTFTALHGCSISLRYVLYIREN